MLKLRRTGSTVHGAETTKHTKVSVLQGEPRKPRMQEKEGQGIIHCRRAFVCMRVCACVCVCVCECMQGRNEGEERGRDGLKERKVGGRE